MLQMLASHLTSYCLNTDEVDLVASSPYRIGIRRSRCLWSSLQAPSLDQNFLRGHEVGYAWSTSISFTAEKLRFCVGIDLTQHIVAHSTTKPDNWLSRCEIAPHDECLPSPMRASAWGRLQSPS